MKVLLLTTAYPDKKNYYNHGFIHSRVKEYQKINDNMVIDIVVVNHDANITSYHYEGIYVTKGNVDTLKNKIEINHYEKVIVHFLDHKIIDFLQKINYTKDLLVWVHGAEALSWKRRTFNKFNLSFLKYILANKKQLKALKKYFNDHQDKITFIFVSKWMKDIMEIDCKITVKNYEIIPNVINTDIFNYKEKTKEDRKRILSIRPYTSRKYATDVVVDTILKLSNDFEDFSSLEFTIIGDGELFDKDTSVLEKFPNVKLIKKFLHYSDIKKYHDENGILLIPTRQDSQGVSMCEGMSSGLVPITTNNTAIPEFVDENCGYLTKSSEELKLAIVELYNEPEKFQIMSRNSSEKIQEKCGKVNTIAKEYKLIYKGKQI